MMNFAKNCGVFALVMGFFFLVLKAPIGGEGKSLPTQEQTVPALNQ